MLDIVKKYASNITKEQIVTFALKENIKLAENEIDIIYNAIKNDIDILLSKNSEEYLNSYKDKISPEAFTCINKLFNKYKSFINL